MNKDTVRKMGSVLEKIVYVICFGVLAVFALDLIADMLKACQTMYPREYRDAANVQLTQAFLDGINPYVLDKSTFQIVNVYTPLNSVIAAAIIKLTGMEILTCHYYLYVFYAVAISALVSYNVYRLVKNFVKADALVLAMTFAVSFSVSWRIGYVSTVPDLLGSLMCLCALTALSFKVNGKTIFISAVCSVLAFYSKQYLLAIAVVVFLYLLVYEWKKALLYFIDMVIVGFGSLAVMFFACPLFLMYNIQFMFMQNTGTSYREIYYSVTQLITVAIVWAIPIAAILLYWLIEFIKNRKNKVVSLAVNELRTSQMGPFWMCLLIMPFLLLYLGTNYGSYLSYQLQLIGPTVIVAGGVALTEIWHKCDKKSLLRIACILAMMVSIVPMYKKLGTTQINTPEQNAAWERVYAMMDEYSTEEDDMYLSPVVSVYAVEKDKWIYHNGHNFMEFLYEGSLYKKENYSSWMDIAFPVFKEFEEYSIESCALVEERVRNKDYKLIITDSGENTSQVMNAKLNEYYEVIAVENLQLGNQNFMMYCWVPIE